MPKYGIICLVFGLLSAPMLESCKKADATEEAHEVSKQAFIDQCIAELADSEFSEFEKVDACVCNHDYLFEKYGKDTYIESRKEEFEDSVEKLLCYISVYKRKARMEETGAGPEDS